MAAPSAIQALLDAEVALSNVASLPTMSRPQVLDKVASMRSALTHSSEVTQHWFRESSSGRGVCADAVLMADRTGLSLLQLLSASNYSDASLGLLLQLAAVRGHVTDTSLASLSAGEDRVIGAEMPLIAPRISKLRKAGGPAGGASLESLLAVTHNLAASCAAAVQAQFSSSSHSGSGGGSNGGGNKEAAALIETFTQLQKQSAARPAQSRVQTASAPVRSVAIVLPNVALPGGGGGGGGASASQHKPAAAAAAGTKALPTLVLDMDECLLHTPIISMNRMGKTRLRPGLRSFLTRMKAAGFRMVIFTAAQPQYADPILDNLERSERGSLFSHRLYRNSCSPRRPIMGRPRGVVKDLNTVPGVDLRRTIMVDNIRENFALQPGNGICIKDYVGQPNDRALATIGQVLQDYADLDKGEPAGVDAVPFLQRALPPCPRDAFNPEVAATSFRPAALPAGSAAGPGAASYKSVQAKLGFQYTSGARAAPLYPGRATTIKAYGGGSVTQRGPEPVLPTLSGLRGGQGGQGSIQQHRPGTQASAVRHWGSGTGAVTARDAPRAPGVGNSSGPFTFSPSKASPPALTYNYGAPSRPRR